MLLKFSVCFSKCLWAAALAVVFGRRACEQGTYPCSFPLGGWMENVNRGTSPVHVGFWSGLGRIPVGYRSSGAAWRMEKSLKV